MAEGKVFLVGAGPGDPALVTMRAAELIASADAILHDRLVPAGVLEGAGAELVDVGKRPGGSREQAAINEELIERARRGQTVVRLKGGDPFVFGRGGEEAQALKAAGIPFEVVPGVTAGIAAPAYAGVPVTHRDAASAVAFVTGHEDPAKAESALDWEALARFPGTLVFYMGVKQLAEIARRLAEAGRPADEPAAVVERGTLPGQRTVVGTLADIAERVEREGIRPPAVTVVGPVARLGDELAWIEQRPLYGRTVVVTRARAQASGLAQRLTGLGAQVVEAPAVRIVPRPADDELSGLVDGIGSYALVCLTSPNGAAILLDLVGDARTLAGERGAEVDVVALYETVAESLGADQLDAIERADYVTFTSSSTVRFFMGALDGRGLPKTARIVSIGPVTSETARELGIDVHAEAERHDIDGLVDALLADAASSAPR